MTPKKPFTEILVPIIESAKNEAIEQQIREACERAALFADLLRDAKTYEEIAQRFVDRELINTHNPSDSVFQFEEIGFEIIGHVAHLLWIPERDPLWNPADPWTEPRSQPLLNYLAKEPKQ